MTTKHFLLLATFANLTYGVCYTLLPQPTAEVYGFGADMTPLSTVLLQFMGVLFFAEGVMCAVAMNAEHSLGRIAVLTFVAVSSLLCFLLDIRTLLGTPGTMDVVDTVVNALFGFGALYYIRKDRQRPAMAS